LYLVESIVMTRFLFIPNQGYFMTKICIIVSSVGKNLTLAKEIQHYLKEKKAEVHILNLVEMNLPMYTSNAESHHSAEKLISEYHETLKADALIFVAPEYNGGPPPVFSNFIAWVSRSTKNWRECFNNKSALIASASGGGGVSALAIMRLQLSFLGMNVMGRQLLSTLEKPHKADHLSEICDRFLDMV
jgi:chromate reductase